MIGRQRDGFTLVELVLVMAISAMVIASAGMMLRQVSAARMRIEEGSEGLLECDYALRAIGTAIVNLSRASEEVWRSGVVRGDRVGAGGRRV